MSRVVVGAIFVAVIGVAVYQFVSHRDTAPPPATSKPTPSPSPPATKPAPPPPPSSATNANSAPATGPSSSEFAGCTNIIVGAGWSGTYFAWRTTLVADAQGKILSTPNTTCIFEAQSRVGGRAYSKRDVPGLPDLRIDLGAYRFDTHIHVLVNEVIQNTLKLPVRCYDPAACNQYGNLQNVRDQYGLDAGYAHGPEGLAALFQKAGGRVFLNHRLAGVYDAPSSSASAATTKKFRLTFTNGKSVEATRVFLNMPSTAINVLNSDSILFTKASADTQYIYTLPVPDPGAKQFLIYPKALWRAVPELTEGLFSDADAHDPPFNGRLHDFYGKCKTGSGDCAGAVMTYYDFEQKFVEYFARFQTSSADPATHIPFDGNTNTTQTAMIRRAHALFITALQERCAALSIPTSKFDPTTIPKPSGTLISVWWNRDFESAINPGPNWVMHSTSDDTRVNADPTHKVRNRISKPLDGYDLYIGNEAFSTGNGWAHPALILTERILYHFLKHKPAFVTDCNDCFSSYKGHDPSDPNTCIDCVSNNWYNRYITPDPPTTGTAFDKPTPAPTVPPAAAGSSPLTFQKDIKGLFRDKDRNAMLFQFDLWDYTSFMEYKDDIIGRITDKTRYGLMTGMPPDITWPESQLDILIRWNASGAANDTSAAGGGGGGGGGSGAGGNCDPNLTFCKSIRPLMRPNDISGMSWSFDLTNYDAVRSRAAVILNRVSLPGAAQGKMPPDAAGYWTAAQIATFSKWMDCGYPPGKAETC